MQIKSASLEILMKIKTINVLLLIMVMVGGAYFSLNERVATLQNKILRLSVYLLKYRMFMSPFVQMCKQLSFHLILFK